MRFITFDDIIDTFLKGKQRGWQFIMSKFTISNSSRTKSAFNKSSKLSSNWWIIPYVQQRKNLKMSGDPNINYKQFLIQELLKNKSNLKLLSLGSGHCGHEIELAQYENFEQITCLDLSNERIEAAKKLAKTKNLNTINFICSDISEFNFQQNHYDIVLFNASLHHFKNVEELLTNKVYTCLNSDGLLIINEYVGPNRLQFPKHQIKEINKALKLIPKSYRKRYNSNFVKNRFFGSGLIRMIVADPSECVDSISIMPTIHDNFETVIEKPYGGNILMNALKDISHHFIDLDKEKTDVLDKLFSFEDEFLKSNPSNFVFGVYKKR